MDVAVVFDIESSPPMPLGIYQRTDEDTVIYLSSRGGFSQAPADCVSVVLVDPISRGSRDELQERANAIYRAERAEEINGGDLECEGHPSGPFDPMGETVYCDGSCRAVSR